MATRPDEGNVQLQMLPAAEALMETVETMSLALSSRP